MALSLITFASGTIIKSSEVNSNFNAINTELFDIDQNNFNAGTQLPDTYLAQIITVDKVDGTAIVNETIDAVKGAVLWFIDGILADGTNVSTEFIIPAILTITGFSARVKTAPIDDDLEIDILKNSTTIFGTPKGVIADGASVDDGNEDITVTDLSPGDILTVDLVLGESMTTDPADLTISIEVSQKVPQ